MALRPRIPDRYSSVVTCFFIHGQPGSGSDMAQIAELLPGSINKVQFDRPGWGASPEAVTDLWGNARFLIAEAEKVRGSRILFGYSYGGSVALAAAALRPDLFGSVVLYAPASGVEALVSFDRMLAQGLFGRTLSNLVILVARKLQEDSYGWGKRAGESFWFEQERLATDLKSLDDAVGGLEVPIVAIHVLGDKVVPLSAAARLVQRAARAEMVLLEGEGHAISPAVAVQSVYEIVRRARYCKILEIDAN